MSVQLKVARSSPKKQREIPQNRSQQPNPPAVLTRSRPCVCGDQRCVGLRRKFEAKEDELWRHKLQSVRFATPKKEEDSTNKRDGEGCQKKIGTRKNIYEKCFGKSLPYSKTKRYVAYLHFPVEHLAYCRSLREQRKTANNLRGTEPSHPVPGSMMISAGLEEFKVEEYQSANCKNEPLYYIPPCVTIREVKYGFAAEAAIERINAKALDSILALDPAMVGSHSTSIPVPEKLTPQSLPTATPPSFSFPLQPVSEEVNPIIMPEKVFSLKTADEVNDGKFEETLDTWQEKDGLVTKEIKKSYAEEAKKELRRHQDFLAAHSKPTPLPDDARIALTCNSSFSPGTIDKYKEWKKSVQNSRKEADERLVVCLANEIGNSYVSIFNKFQASATTEAKKEPNPMSPVDNCGRKTPPIVTVDPSNQKMPAIATGTNTTSVSKRQGTIASFCTQHALRSDADVENISTGSGEVHQYPAAKGLNSKPCNPLHKTTSYAGLPILPLTEGFENTKIDTWMVNGDDDISLSDIGLPSLEMPHFLDMMQRDNSILAPETVADSSSMLSQQLFGNNPYLAPAVQAPEQSIASHFHNAPIPTQEAKQGTPRPKRRRKPQKPGKTATHNDSLIHKYNDHANDADENNEKAKDVEQVPYLQQNGVSVAFPVKLHNVLDQVEANGLGHVISWQPHGRCFVVHKPKEFLEHVLPKYFHQTKLTSFLRQLKLYGFSRLTRGNDAGGYYHELFLRGKQHLCKKMVRSKANGTKIKTERSPDGEPDFYKMTPVLITPQHRREGNLAAQAIKEADSMRHFFSCAPLA